VLHSVLSDEECNRMIGWSEQQGYQDAGEQETTGPGTSDQPAPFACCPVVPEGLAELLRLRSAPCIWPGTGGPPTVDLEQLCFFRFDRGQRLLPGCGCRSGKESPGQMTLLVSLNNGFKGG